MCWVAQWCWAALQWLVVLCWLVWCVLLLVLSLQHSGTVVEHYTAKLVQWGAVSHSSVLLFFLFRVLCATQCSTALLLLQWCAVRLPTVVAELSLEKF